TPAVRRACRRPGWEAGPRSCPRRRGRLAAPPEDRDAAVRAVLIGAVDQGEGVQPLADRLARGPGVVDLDLVEAAMDREGELVGDDRPARPQQAAIALVAKRPGDAEA